MTDLSSVNRVGPTRNRTYWYSNGVTFSGTGYYRTRETTPRDLHALHDGAFVWRTAPPTVAASDFADVA